MSASAPLGTPSRNTGNVDADCTSATITGSVVSEVMSQAAATSFIHMHIFAVSHVPQSMRNVACRSGAQAVAGGGVEGGGEPAGGTDMTDRVCELFSR